ncbi:MAG: TraB/GumN family protein [Sphingopyxis sp.]|uniref:TraB/GumN family protein n=1 Tax=Sphingopyxis sp. TaxID=1908224 RepID=UPI002AB9069A|nr:TraB/GumN family protein [Sphingopyxis sp.]MDZ3831322.1 TraB/GumN family protein [Sphingopyxis sp.]
MKKWFQKLALGCALLPLALHTTLPAATAAETTEPVAATAAPVVPTVDADPALWVVKDEDTTIYLFGTVHVLKPGLGWFDEAVKDAFDQSDELMLEIVMPDDPAAMAKTMMPLAVDPNGKALSSRLGADDLKAYQAAMTDIGIPAAQFEMFEPWFVAVTMSMLPLAKLGYDPEQGAEKQLTTIAKQNGKPISGLETVEQQLGYLDQLPEAAQVNYLNTVVRDIAKMGPTLDTLVAQWAAGDPDALAGTMNESLGSTPELAKTLLWDRNLNWADQITARMAKPGTVFIAVGAGHLAGEKSVQDYLKERGLTAERIEY